MRTEGELYIFGPGHLFAPTYPRYTSLHADHKHAVLSLNVTVDVRFCIFM